MKHRTIRSSFLVTLLFLLLVPAGVRAQVDIQSLDQRFEQARSNWDVPGMAVAIVSDGEIVFAKGYGVLERGKSEPVDENTLFAIASNTKAFIAASLASLVDEGRISWDDPVRKYLPYFTLYDSYASSEARIRDLLSHRLGLGTFSGDVVWYKSSYSAEEVVRRAAFLPQAYGFRAGYGYSNIMFVASGEVIKSATGQSWSQYVREHFLQPLHMNRTRTSTGDLVSMDNVATPHKIVAGENVPIPWVNWDNMGAAGGIISSVRDMARWISLQLDHGIAGADTLFTPRAQSEMWRTHNAFRVSDSAGKFYPGRNFSGYGLGWGTSEYRGRFLATHSGGYDGMYSRVGILPGENLGIVVLTNSMKSIGTWLMYDVIDAFLGDPVRDWSAAGLERDLSGRAAFEKRISDQQAMRVSETTPRFSFEDYAGTYHSDFYGNIDVAVVGDSLRLLFPRAPALNATLRHWQYDTYELDWDEVHAWFSFGTLQFTADNLGRVDGMRFDVPNNDIFFEEIHLKKIR
jgi:CubicO group peptidase (beta-lactamase class C family)